MKSVYRKKKASFHWWAARYNKRSLLVSLINKLRMNRDSIGYFVSTSVYIPGHALHEKGLQRQIDVGTLVNSQQRRALAVPRLNRWSTAGQPLVNRTFCSFTGLHRISFVRACEETFRTVFYSALEG